VGERNLDTALSNDGAWRYILEQKAAGRARFVGITGHNNPANFMRMLATDEVDVMMTIMNFVDHSTYGFSRGVREEALARGVGVMAMKVFGGTESVLRPGGGLANSNAPEPHPSNMELALTPSAVRSPLGDTVARSGSSRRRPAGSRPDRARFPRSCSAARGACCRAR
jgi:hypothetical protein